MRRYFDFYVKFDPKTDSVEVLTTRILDDVINGRLRSNKPCVIYIGGGSGEGKSYAVLKLQEVLCTIKNLSPVDLCIQMNHTTPLQYRDKLQALLFDDKYKELDIIAMHEARECVNAKLWQSFVTQAIGHVNAMSRSIKPLCIMIVSQFIRDISNDIRYTLNYYCIAHRPRGQSTRLEMYTIYHDDSDIDSPKIKKRRLCGYIVYPNGRKKFYQPRYLELKLPDAEMCRVFDKMDTESKEEIIRRKMDRLFDALNQELGVQSSKVDAMVEFYGKNTDSLALIGKLRKGEWIITKKVQEMHDLKDYEVREFQKKINLKLREKLIPGLDDEVINNGISAQVSIADPDDLP